MSFRTLLTTFLHDDNMIMICSTVSLLTQTLPPVYPTAASFIELQAGADSASATHLNTVTRAPTCIHMLGRRGWICILFPSRLNAWSEARWRLKKANCLPERWKKEGRERGGGRMCEDCILSKLSKMTKESRRV